MDLSELVTRQRHYFHEGLTRPVSLRRQMLLKLKKGIQRHEDALLSALEQDLGKSRFEGYETELGVVYAELRHAWNHAEKWSATRRVSTPLAHFPSSSRIYREPYGVALILSPWNYPIQLTLVPLISAIAAGCTAVVKPSAYAPASSSAIAALIADVFDPAFVTVVQGGRKENTALLEQKFDFVFFTGSGEVGKSVMTAAARHLTPVALELGGKSPVIITHDADLDLAAKRIVWGKFLNAGQTCVAPDHIWIMEEARDCFVEKLIKYITQFYGEHPLESSDLPHIINQKHFDRLLGLLKSGSVAFGGGYDPATLRLEPTVLVDVCEEDAVMGEEIFGPLLPVLTYRDLDELIDHLQTKPRPLALYVFTRNKWMMQKISDALPFGGGCMNDTIVHLANGNLPFGGVGESGMGSCHGEWGFRTFTHDKSILRKFSLDLPVRYPPHKGKGLGLLKKLM